VIGSGGKVIREIVEKTGAKIDIEDDGTSRSPRHGEAIKAAIKWIKSIVAEPEVGQIYDRQGREGRRLRRLRELLRRQGRPRPHLAAGAERVNKTSDVVKEGDKVKVKLLGFDDRGKVRLSMKVVDQATGACPSRVRTTSPGRRSNNTAPSSISSSLICMESAGWLTAHSSAARPKWPSRAAASK
jgi:polyribonucleotide nucleotidyltransferase